MFKKIIELIANNSNRGNIVIQNGNIVGGDLVSGDRQMKQGYHYEIKVQGDVNKIDTQGSVHVDGSVRENIKTQGSVHVGEGVGGNINTQGSVRVGGDLGGNIQTMGSVNIGGQRV